jgi:hypothetical protein
MKKFLSIIVALSLMISFGLVGASCGTDVSANTGTIEVRVTDAPPEYDIATIDVTFSEVAIHTAGDDGDGGWTYIPIDIEDGSLDLLLLQDGVDALLATGLVTPGNYTQLRVIIDTIAVTLEGGGDPPEVILPSGELKLVRPFTIEEGVTTTLLLDFIAAESIVVTGAGKIIFKPVVKLTIQQGETE